MNGIRWTKEQYEDFLRRRKTPRPKPEQDVRHEPVEKEKRKTENPKRFLVSIVSYRSRLCDPDNLCPKYFVDCLRYAEIIPDDSPAEIELKVSQVKEKRKLERTEIAVYEIT